MHHFCTDQLVATSRAEFIGDQVGCTVGRRVGETGRPHRSFFWIGPLRHSLIRRLTRSRNRIRNKIPSYCDLRRHGPLVRGDLRALVFELVKVFDGILLCRKCGPQAHLKRMCEHRHVPVARMGVSETPARVCETLRTRSHASATICGAWTSSGTAHSEDVQQPVVVHGRRRRPRLFCGRQVSEQYDQRPRP